RGDGTLLLLVATHVSMLGLNLPPVFVPEVGVRMNKLYSFPPQTTISVPVQIAVWPNLAVGALPFVVAQLLVVGLYRPPVLKPIKPSPPPPHTTISVPVQIAVCVSRAQGALFVLVAVQRFVSGLYLPPVLVS